MVLFSWWRKEGIDIAVANDFSYYELVREHYGKTDTLRLRLDWVLVVTNSRKRLKQLSSCYVCDMIQEWQAGQLRLFLEHRMRMAWHSMAWHSMAWHDRLLY